MTHNYNSKDLESSDRDKRIAVIEGIRRSRALGDLDILVDHLEREPERAIKEKIVLVLDDLLPDADAVVVSRMLRSNDAFTRNCAVETMKVAGDQVVPVLGVLAADSDRDVRKFAIDALTTRDTPEVRDILRERLSDPDPNVVYTAVEYLGTLKDVDAATAIELLACNSNNNPMLFCSCLESLAKIGSAACNKDLLAYCKAIGEDPLFRYSILKYLGCCAAYETVEDYVLELVGQSSEIFAKEIVDTVEAVCRRQPDALIGPEFKVVLRRLLNSVGAAESRYELARLLADNDNVDATRATALFDLGSADDMVVLAAVEIIGKYGKGQDVDALEKVTENTDSDEILELIGDAVGKIFAREGE